MKWAVEGKNLKQHVEVSSHDSRENNEVGFLLQGQKLRLPKVRCNYQKTLTQHICGA